MKLLFQLFLILVVTSMSGCASYYASRSNYNTVIDEWLRDNEFYKIEESLKKLSPGHPDYKAISARKNEIKIKQQAYIDKSLLTAKNFIAQEKWQKALDTYTDTLKKVENNNQLIDAQQTLLKERDTQVTELIRNMLLRRARALVQYKPIYTKLGKLIPNDYKAQHDIKKFESEQNDTSADLLEYGKHAFKIKNYSLAEECLELSHSLVPSEKTLEFINKTKHIITAMRFQ